MTAPLTVPVIISNHNSGDYVGAAIASALNLHWPDAEAFVVDNGSTDHSRAVITVIHLRKAKNQVLPGRPWL